MYQAALPAQESRVGCLRGHIAPLRLFVPCDGRTHVVVEGVSPSSHKETDAASRPGAARNLALNCSRGSLEVSRRAWWPDPHDTPVYVVTSPRDGAELLKPARVGTSARLAQL